MAGEEWWTVDSQLEAAQWEAGEQGSGRLPGDGANLQSSRLYCLSIGNNGEAIRLFPD